MIRPSHEEIIDLKAAGKPYSYEISDELLLRRFPPQKDKVDEAVSIHQQTGESKSIVAVLKEQLLAKDRQLTALETQLDRKDQQISSLSERQREANILMKNLQERLALEAPKKQPWSLSRLLRK